MSEIIGTLQGRLQMPRMTHAEFEAQVSAMGIRVRPFAGMWAREAAGEPSEESASGTAPTSGTKPFASLDADPLFLPDAADYPRHLDGTLAFVREEGGDERGEAETNSLLARAVAAGVLRALDERAFRAAIAGGRLGQNVGRNEHDVFLDSVSGRVFKLTRDDGLSPRQGLLGYLERLGESNRLWADDFRLEGVFLDGVFVDGVPGATRLMVSQPLLKGRAATPAEIATYMRAKSYKQYSDRGWWNEGSELLISDAEPVNVLMGCDGMVYPIDVIPAHPPASRVEMYNQVVASREAME